MIYEYWYANIQGISAREKCWLRDEFESAKSIYYIEETVLEQHGVSDKIRHKIMDHPSEKFLEADYFKAKEKGIQFVTLYDQNYPACLRDISSPPYAIFYKGKLPEKSRKSIAIIGARECSQYGREMAAAYAKELAGHGIQIISGMARGIDSIGQWGAIEAGGESYAVLGCGVDICYPREHFKLYKRLEEQGGILSEFPMGTEPLKSHFPARNRIISGLSDIILVIEAKEKSGSLITADMALEQGKDVYALPGLATSKLSEGCHMLIKQGAGILISPKDLLLELGICSDAGSINLTENKIVLESEENIVYSCLNFQPSSPGYLSAVTKLPIRTIMDILVRLELKGYVREVSKNNYVTIGRK